MRNNCSGGKNPGRTRGDGEKKSNKMRRQKPEISAFAFLGHPLACPFAGAKSKGPRHSVRWRDRHSVILAENKA